MQQTIGYLPGLEETALSLLQHGFSAVPFSPGLRCCAILYDSALGHSFEQICPGIPCLLVNIQSLTFPQLLTTLKEGRYSPLFLTQLVSKD